MHNVYELCVYNQCLWNVWSSLHDNRITNLNKITLHSSVNINVYLIESFLKRLLKMPFSNYMPFKLFNICMLNTIKIWQIVLKELNNKHLYKAAPKRAWPVLLYSTSYTSMNLCVLLWLSKFIRNLFRAKLW